MNTAMHGHTGARAHYMHTLHPLGEQVQALRVMHAVDALHAPSGIFFAWMSQQRSPKAAPAAAKRTPKTAGAGKERARGGGAARSALPDGLCYKRWDELMRVGAPHARTVRPAVPTALPPALCHASARLVSRSRSRMRNGRRGNVGPSQARRRALMGRSISKVRAT